MEWKLELVPVPVCDVDRAKAFYNEKAGFNEDHDVRPTDEMRIVQLTPPGGRARSFWGLGSWTSPPGSVRGLHLVVSNIDAARAELAGRGVDVGEVQDLEGALYVPFRDPDGNSWTLQEIRDRD